MASTFKRTYTDMMDFPDLELTKTVSNNNNNNNTMADDFQQHSQTSQNDFLQYLSLPNVSQESLQKLLESDAIEQNQTPNETIDINNYPELTDESIDPSPSTNIYNAYANTESFANPHLTDYLYTPTNLSPTKESKNKANHNQINPQFTNQQQNHISYNYTTPSTSPEDLNVNDDILMVPQDNFYVYDQQDPQFIPEMMQLELNNKSFPHSNELNIFKPNDVLYEFSDEEEDDDDMYMQNNGDMEMKMDEQDDDDDEEDDLYQIHRPLDSSMDSMRRVEDSSILLNDNSIYSLTVPNNIAPESLSASPTNHFPSPLDSAYHNINLYGSDNDDDNQYELDDEDEEPVYNYFNQYDNRLIHNDVIENSEDEVDDDEDDDEDEDDEDEDEDENENEYAIGMDLDGGIHTPVFRERKQSVVAESKPRFNKDRVNLSRSNTRPKRVRRKSASASSSASNMNRVITSSTLRKPRIAVTAIPPSEKQFSISTLQNSMNPDDSSEDHVCNIPNPKTGKPCLKRFSRPYDLIRHQNTIHASKRSFYRCMFCEDDLRRKHELDINNEIVDSCKYRDSQFSIDNSQSHVTSSHNIKKIKSAAFNNSGYLSNKTFSRCDALTRHLRFRHGLNNDQVVDAMDYAKRHVEYYDN